MHDLAEIEPFRIDSFKEVITPKTFEYSPVTDCFPRVDGQTSKLMSFGTSVAYHRQHSPKEIHPCQSRGKCGRRKKFLSGSGKHLFLWISYVVDFRLSSPNSVCVF